MRSRRVGVTVAVWLISCGTVEMTRMAGVQVAVRGRGMA